jgi:hypothetical protein
LKRKYLSVPRYLNLQTSQPRPLEEISTPVNNLNLEVKECRLMEKTLVCWITQTIWIQWFMSQRCLKDSLSSV